MNDVNLAGQHRFNDQGFCIVCGANRADGVECSAEPGSATEVHAVGAPAAVPSVSLDAMLDFGTTTSRAAPANAPPVQPATRRPPRLRKDDAPAFPPPAATSSESTPAPPPSGARSQMPPPSAVATPAPVRVAPQDAREHIAPVPGESTPDAKVREALANLEQYKTAGYRMVGVLGLRGGGKSAIIVRLLEALQENEHLHIDHRSAFWETQRRILDNRVLPRTDELVLDVYAGQTADGSQKVAFIDVSGEHFNPINDSARETLRMQVLSYLNDCDAFMLVYPLHDFDTYTQDHKYHERHVRQAIAIIVGAVNNQVGGDGPPSEVSRIDKPLAVLFSKADQYPEEINPGGRPVSPAMVAAQRFAPFGQVVGFFTHVRFCFVSTGVWERTGDSIFRLRPDSASRGLLGAYRYVRRSPSSDVWPTRVLLDRARLLRLLAKLPWLGGTIHG